MPLALTRVRPEHLLPSSLSLLQIAGPTHQTTVDALRKKKEQKEASGGEGENPPDP